MELVRFKTVGGVVIVRIAITGLVAWRYKYIADEYQFIKSSLDPSPYEHALGLPHELDNDIDTWDVQLANLSLKSQAYEILIEWLQNGEPTPLGLWKKSGTLVPTSPATVEKGSAMLVGV